MLRMIREEEPPKPSTRLSTAERLADDLAANRGTEPAKLTKLVRGELDWIVMKALEKDRNRRYETANGLAADVQRYLNDEPVQACPPSAWYRFRKFARRNQAAAGDGVGRRPGGAAGGGGAGDEHRPDRAASNEPTANATCKPRPGPRTTRRRGSYFHRITLAHRELSADNLGRALRTPRRVSGRPARVGMALPHAALPGRAGGPPGQDGSQQRGVQPRRRAPRLRGRGRDRQDLEQQDGQGDPDASPRTPIRSSASRSTPTASTWPPSARTGR